MAQGMLANVEPSGSLEERMVRGRKFKLHGAFYRWYGMG
jgi:hypothetical protein